MLDDLNVLNTALRNWTVLESFYHQCPMDVTHAFVFKKTDPMKGMKWKECFYTGCGWDHGTYWIHQLYLAFSSLIFISTHLLYTSFYHTTGAGEVCSLWHCLTQNHCGLVLFFDIPCLYHSMSFSFSLWIVCKNIPNLVNEVFVMFCSWQLQWQQ